MHTRSALVATALLTAAIVAGNTAPAGADTTTCPSTYACVWKDASYRTSGNSLGYLKWARFISRFSAYRYNGTTDTVQDDASSAKNNGTSQDVYFFKDEYCRGAMFALSRGANDGDFNNGTPAGGFNDTLDSGAFSAFRSAC